MLDTQTRNVEFTVTAFGKRNSFVLDLLKDVFILGPAKTNNEYKNYSCCKDVDLFSSWKGHNLLQLTRHGKSHVRRHALKGTVLLCCLQSFCKYCA